MTRVVVVRCCGVAAAAVGRIAGRQLGILDPCVAAASLHFNWQQGIGTVHALLYSQLSRGDHRHPWFSCRTHLRWSHLAHQLVLGSTTHTMPCSGGEEGGCCVHRLPACPAVQIQSRAIHLNSHCRVAGAVG